MDDLELASKISLEESIRAARAKLAFLQQEAFTSTPGLNEEGPLRLFVMVLSLTSSSRGRIIRLYGLRKGWLAGRGWHAGDAFSSCWAVFC